jgi:peptidoglycan/LPS O-acetylase OafA/YrhL
MKERNISVDFLKFLAVLFITNSHMGPLYAKYSFLATGGCIGDVLFFFCSGFTLFLKPMEGIKQFPNWYKQRINRIYPSLFAVAIFSVLIFHIHWDLLDLVVARKYWFVSCIMLYYAVIYFVGSYMKSKINVIAVLVAIGTAVWFYMIYQTPGYSIYSPEYTTRWLLFFIFMLLGAKIGANTQSIVSKPVADICFLLLSVICFYGMFIAGIRIESLAVLQYFSFIPLLIAVYYFYKVGTNPWVEKLYRSKVGNFIIRFVGGLCLEIYMVQFYFFTDKLNNIFPLNIIIVFIIIVMAAYIIRCFARFLSQTFKDAPYDWKKIVSFY